MKVTNKSARIIGIQTQGQTIGIAPLATVEFLDAAEADVQVYLAGSLKPLVDSGELIVEATPPPPPEALRRAASK
jgi:hypothetical protein